MSAEKSLMGPETHTYVSSLMAAHQAAAAAAAAAAAHASAKLSPEVELTTKTLKPGMVGIRSDLIGLGGGLPGGAPPPPPPDHSKLAAAAKAQHAASMQDKLQHNGLVTLSRLVNNTFQILNIAYCSLNTEIAGASDPAPDPELRNFSQKHITFASLALPARPVSLTRLGKDFVYQANKF